MEEFVPISKLLSHGRNFSTPVCLTKEGIKTFQTFLKDIENLYLKLSNSEELKYCLFCQSSYAFAVSFMALLHSEKHIMLPPNRQAGTLDEFSQIAETCISDCLLDFGGKATVNPLKQAKGQIKGPSVKFQELPTKQQFLTLYTSGSTGTPKAVKKTLSNFDWHKL